MNLLFFQKILLVIGEDFEEEVFGERIFTYPMRGPYIETMIHAKTNLAKGLWRKLQLNAYTLLSSNSPFIGCQYFAVRGVRTLNGKLIQHQLSQFYFKDTEKEHAPIPSKVSYHHFRDESFHFNSSTVISHDVLNSLKEPTRFEIWVANQGLRGSQKDHYHFSTAVNGLFWYDPALYPKVYKILRSPVFGMSHGQARRMMEATAVTQRCCYPLQSSPHTVVTSVAAGKWMRQLHEIITPSC